MCSVHDAAVINNINSFWHGIIYNLWSMRNFVGEKINIINCSELVEQSRSRNNELEDVVSCEWDYEEIFFELWILTLFFASYFEKNLIDVKIWI